MRKRVSLQLRYIEIYARGAAGEQAIDEAADLAKGFGDAHDISTPTRPGDRLMDLYNNMMPTLADVPAPYVRNRPGKKKYNTITAKLQSARTRGLHSAAAQRP